jgi:FMN reductase (NADPH)/FMN reductase [NAD(P)H]
MNEILNVINRRRSTRVFSSEPINSFEKDQILNAALRAPTAGNMMLYTIIEVQDQAIKDRLAETCDNQPFIARAPLVLLFLADYQRWMDYFTLCGTQQRCRELGLTYRTPQEGDLLLACCDALVAAQNAVLAAESLGIGSCYIGDILEQAETHRQLFNLPPHALPITLLVFGHHLKAHDSDSPIPRFEREFIVQTDSYRRLEPQEYERMFQPMQPADPSSFQHGALNLGQEKYFHKFIADFSLELNRSVKEMIKNWIDPLA